MTARGSLLRWCEIGPAVVLARADRVFVVAERGVRAPAVGACLQESPEGLTANVPDGNLCDDDNDVSQLLSGVGVPVSLDHLFE